MKAKFTKIFEDKSLTLPVKLVAEFIKDYQTFDDDLENLDMETPSPKEYNKLHSLYMLLSAIRYAFVKSVSWDNEEKNILVGDINRHGGLCDCCSKYLNEEYGHIKEIYKIEIEQ